MTLLRKIFSLVGALVLGATLALSASSPAAAAHGQTYLDPGQSLLPGQWIKAGNYTLIMQRDGNLVFYYKYQQSGQRACAASHTTAYPGSHVWMRPDGTFSLYTPSNAVRWTTAPNTLPASEWRGGWVQIVAGEAWIWTSNSWKFRFWHC